MAREKTREKWGTLSVMERTKITEEMAAFISDKAYEEGWSRSRVVREALHHYAKYEQGEVLTEVKRLKDSVDELRILLAAVGRFQEERFESLERKVAELIENPPLAKLFSKK